MLLEYVGGKGEHCGSIHCVSRMRFVLNDPAKADVAKIEALKSAHMGTFTQAGQFQVIIGNTVSSDFYNDFIVVSALTVSRRKLSRAQPSRTRTHCRRS